MALESEMPYPYLPAARQTGSEPFKLGDQLLPLNLLSFWQWSASDVIGNTMRGCLAEYIVAMALGIADGVRNDWRAYDLQFNGWKIEVKASAYLQSWFQKRLSRPIFSIRPAREWDPVTNEMVGDPCRHAHLYIFCLHDHKDKVTLNVLNLSQWSFYVLPTVRLDGDKRYEKAKSISLDGIRSLKPNVARYCDLRDCVLDATREFELSATVSGISDQGKASF